jgi:hypothetical protein
VLSACLAHLILFDFVTIVLFGEKYELGSSALCSFVHPPVNYFVLDLHALMSTLF